ncbi:MAG TPA: iron-sulfur cluster-binding domain-containing protein [Chitinophagaceae bacterium]|nr:iron-sulfur cluster-binding domain-containing protein [Chitinophagaceae bacterium]
MSSQLTIKEVILETHNTKSFVLETPKDFPITYKAGQFISLIHPENNKIRRSYSFASCPQTEAPKITVKRVNNGALSRYLFDLTQVGDTFHYSQIGGLFTVTDEDLINPKQQFIFFAAGSGITPCISMIKQLIPMLKPEQRIRLIYSNNSKASTIFFDELSALEEQHPQFKIEWLFSDSENLLKSRLNNFLLIDFLEEWMEGLEKKDFQYYICGPIDYMDTITITLLTEGFKTEQIRKEVFYNPHTDTFKKPLPPDKETRFAAISFKGKNYKIEVPYPKSILQAANDYGIELPFSCESGQCGSCIATLKEGEIWMSYNEVLTDRDFKKGLRLTCTGHPVGGDIDIEY